MGGNYRRHVVAYAAPHGDHNDANHDQITSRTEPLRFRQSEHTQYSVKNAAVDIEHPPPDIRRGDTARNTG